ncbi:MAG: hypothetical protein SO297_01940 [Clostridium paraputrificum]|nr:hypothetical protein [Clostridium paraputrificum]MDY4720690.1 hypothetical protein [Clostridium paraputrificum]
MNESNRWNEFNSIVDTLNLDVKEKGMLLIIFRYVNHKLGYANPSRTLLKKLTGISDNRTLDNILKSLTEKGFLYRESGKGIRSKYFVRVGGEITPSTIVALSGEITPSVGGEITPQKENKKKIKENNIYSPLDSENYIEEVNKKLEEDLIKKITSTYDKSLVMNELKKLKDKSLVGIDLLQELERNLKASEKEKCSNEVKEIFEYWNSKNIIKHKAMSDEIKKAIKKSLKVYSKNEIVQAIETYSEILNSDFYFNHKWSLRDFFNRKNGISTFTEEGSNKSNYEEWKKGIKLKDKIESKEKKEIKLRGWD